MDADLAGAGGGRWWGGPTLAVATATSTDVMNQQCRVCGEPAAGFHFGAFTCEGCKSFFGRTYNNLSSISECKNNGGCVINKKNRTSCKACRLRKCLMVGMSKSGSRYGRRSNWFKIHCLLQEQQQQHSQQHQQQQFQHPQGKNKPWDTGPPPPLSKTLEDNNNHLVKHPLGLLSPHSGFPHQSDAAAFWAARASLLHPLGGHSPSLPHLSMPFLPPAFLTTAYRPPPRPLLLPFVHLTPDPTTSPPSSSASSASSASTSPTEQPPTSGEAALRALGPVQEQPIDLSRGAGAAERQAGDEQSEHSDATSESEEEQKVEEEEEDDQRKATTPLDLTFKT